MQAEPPAGGQYDIDQNQLMRAARDSVHAGVMGLQRIFGLDRQQTGAIPTQEGEVQRQQGVQRFARGEGAATRDEIAAIDQTLGMDRVNGDEGMKNLMRIDKVAQYYLMRGEKDKAEAASASLLQYGAVQVRQSAVMAQTAFAAWQQSGDPADLRRASIAIQRAHQFIPDGMNLKIDVDPRTRQIVATVAGPDGRAQQHVVDPQAVPQLMQQAMDGSAYWRSVYQIGQPRLAEQEITQEGYNQRAADTRQYEEYKNDREAQEEEYRFRRGIETGATEKERRFKANEQYYGDWQQRMMQASPEEKSALIQEGLQFTYDQTPSRRTPIDSATYAPPADSPIEDADAGTVQSIAQMLGAKNPELDGGSAMQMATALVTSPQVVPGRYGTLDVAGFNLVFNPQMLPQLRQLRTKYKQTS